ncbi:MAG: chemotaxis protein MotB [Firmicutes bacterium]|nr:chemotaxis protein MotB [Bacillota bacterium]
MSKKHKKPQHSEEEGGEAWLLPYSDLMTLLLAVFIVLFAVSKVDQTKAENLAEAFRGNMMTEGSGLFSGEGDSVVPLLPDEIKEELPKETTSQSVTKNPEASVTPQAESSVTQDDLTKFLGKLELSKLEDLKKNLDTELVKQDMTDVVTTNIDMRGLIISFNNAILFESGSADIKKGNQPTLIKVADLIKTLDNYIRIEGHTDNVPMHSDIYPSNWELSTARAASVVRLFVQDSHIQPDKLVAVGYGEYRPVADNATVKGREKNRRIDIIVLSEKYNNLEK